ncbi:MAG: Bug family tripartite tricarboxylate transporter substrate binding protein [Pseudolabrys sp.]
MSGRRRLAALFSVVIAASFAAAPAAAQSDYPQRTVTFITPAAAGNSPDVATRVIADRLATAWKQQVVVFNRPGAGGLIAAQAASTVTPDGYTLYMTQASTFTVLPITQAEKAAPLLKTFVPIALIAEQPIAVSASPALPVKTVAELIDYIKKQPDGIPFAASNRGGQSHLTGELFARRTGVKMSYIHGPNAATSVTDVSAGRIPIMFEGIAGVAGAMQGGSVRVLAVGSAKRLSNYPDLPTISETVPGFESKGWIMLMAPSGTPDAIVQKVAADLRAIVEHPEVAQRFASIGTYPRWLGPAEAAAYIKKEQDQWWPLVREVGVKR